jgi:TRAP transporter TAXI family solute receptor
MVQEDFMNFMKRVGAFAVLAGLASAVAFSTSPEAQTRRVVTIASGAVDGVYYPIAGAISRITSEDKALNIRATVESSGGSVANVERLRSGEADFALLQNDIAYYAFNGITLHSFVGKPVKSMAGVFSVYPELVHIVVTHESGVKSARDLKGKRVALGSAGSATEQNALQILAAHGIVEGDLRAAVRGSFSATADQLKAGVLDAAFFSIALGAPVITDVLGSGKVALVGVLPSASDALLRKYPFYTMGEIPANTYKGQEREVSSPAVMAMLVARSALPEDLVYRFTRAVFDNLSQFHAAHPAARNLTLQTALVGMALPLHPGAERFFKDKGIAR